MKIPETISIGRGNENVIWCVFVDQNNNNAPVNNAVVTATLYKGRKRGDPSKPGTVVTGIDKLPLVYVPDSAGRYEGTISSTFLALPSSGYVMVFEGTSQSMPNPWHREILAEVVQP